LGLIEVSRLSICVKPDFAIRDHDPLRIHEHMVRNAFGNLRDKCRCENLVEPIAQGNGNNATIFRRSKILVIF